MNLDTNELGALADMLSAQKKRPYKKNLKRPKKTSTTGEKGVNGRSCFMPARHPNDH